MQDQHYILGMDCNTCRSSCGHRPRAVVSTPYSNRNRQYHNKRDCRTTSTRYRLCHRRKARHPVADTHQGKGSLCGTRSTGKHRCNNNRTKRRRMHLSLLRRHQLRHIGIELNCERQTTLKHTPKSLVPSERFFLKILFSEKSYYLCVVFLT